MSFGKRITIGTFFLLISLALLGYWILISSLPDKATIKKFRPETTVIHLNNFNWAQEIISPVRRYVPLNRISPELRTAVLISEDDTFFKHSGINLTELKKAFQENLKKKRYARGASTITMQLARNAFLTRKKTLLRKFREIILAKKIERIWNKQKIFEYYLNIVEWGENIYGAEAATRFYFGKSANQVNLAEAALLAGILPNPIELNPFHNWSRVKKRQIRVLKLMRVSKLITEQEFKDLVQEKIYLRGTSPIFKVELERKPEISIFEQALRDPRIPEKLKQKADSTGIIFLPED